MAHNSNKVTLSSDKTDDYEQLTCPTMHSQCENKDINKEDNETLNVRQNMVVSTSEI